METIVKINASDYGLDSTKAQEIEAMFKPMLEKMTALETEYNEVLKLEISPETCQSAKELRLKYVKVRTATAEIHKQLKEFYLKGGRFVDGWKNAQLFASQQIEDTLKKIETHYEIIEAERKAKLKEERTALIQPYVEDVNTFMLQEMTEEAFQILLKGTEMQYKARIEAEKKAEEERIAKEKADVEERMRIKADNERLEKEATRLAAEIKAKEDAEREAERKKKTEERKAKNAPDKEKLLTFMQSINDLARPEVKSIEAADIASKANIKLVEISNFIRDNANKL
jgi:hypothetical protein